MGPGIIEERQRDVVVKACLDVGKTQQVETFYLLEGLCEVRASAAELPGQTCLL